MVHSRSRIKDPIRGALAHRFGFPPDKLAPSSSRARNSATSSSLELHAVLAVADPADVIRALAFGNVSYVTHEQRSVIYHHGPRGVKMNTIQSLSYLILLGQTPNIHDSLVILLC